MADPQSIAQGRWIATDAFRDCPTRCQQTDEQHELLRRALDEQRAELEREQVQL